MNKQSIIEAAGGVARQCEECGTAFFQFGRRQTTQRHCPKCKDIESGNFTVCQERTQIGFWTGLIVDDSFPSDGWEAVQTPDGLRWKLDRRGVYGQVVIWAQTPPRAGESVSLRQMTSTHSVRVTTEIRKHKSNGEEIERAVLHRRPALGNDGREDTETHRYYVIIPCAVGQTGWLCWAKDGGHPVKIITPTVSNDVYLSPATLAKLTEDEDDQF